MKRIYCSLILCFCFAISAVMLQPTLALAANTENMQPSIAPFPADATPAEIQQAFDDSLDDYNSQPKAIINDPLEPWNRFWFGFNDIFYLYIVKPMYRGYVFITPQEFRTGVKNFFHNLFFPVRFVNNILQGKPKAAGVEFGRFVINTTVGFGGLIDVAKGRKTIVPVDESGESFGQTLGYWGFGHGFYIVWPFLGPSSLRESIGLVGDSYSNPLAYISSHQIIVQSGISVGKGISQLDTVLDSYENVKNIAVDPYIAAREAYISYRDILVQR